MRYRSWAPAVLALPALMLAACASGTNPSTASGNSSPSASHSSMPKVMSGKSPGMMSSGSATLMKVKTSAGPVLADSKGLTLYWYAKDTRMASACTGGCAMAWPPVTGSPMAAMGVKLTGKLGTISRGGGVLQATYKGHPLYTYADDTAPGQIKGNDVGGVWHVLHVSSIGAVAPGSIMMSGSSPSPAMSSSSGGSGGGGYGGGGY
jgi:predicted lipoprotein with Yx(FWY)xxD motif